MGRRRGKKGLDNQVGRQMRDEGRWEEVQPME